MAQSWFIRDSLKHAPYTHTYIYKIIMQVQFTSVHKLNAFYCLDCVKLAGNILLSYCLAIKKAFAEKLRAETFQAPNFNFMCMTRNLSNCYTLFIGNVKLFMRRRAQHSSCSQKAQYGPKGLP